MSQQPTPQQTRVRSYLLLSVQRALLGEVTPGLRAVLVRWTSAPDATEPTAVDAEFFYDDEIDDDDVEHVSEVEGYVAADYQPDVSVTFTPIHLSASRRLPTVGGEDLLHAGWAYRRFEE